MACLKGSHTRKQLQLKAVISNHTCLTLSLSIQTLNTIGLTGLDSCTFASYIPDTFKQVQVYFYDMHLSFHAMKSQWNLYGGTSSC